MMIQAMGLSAKSKAHFIAHLFHLSLRLRKERFTYALEQMSFLVAFLADLGGTFLPCR